MLIHLLNQVGDPKAEILSKTSNGNFDTKTRKTEFTVTLKKVSQKDIGNYTCWVEYASGTLPSLTSSYLKLLCESL